MSFYNYKKILIALGIMAILFPSILFFAPKKAQAVVPVLDAPVGASTAATAGSTGALVKKDYILDTVAYAAAGVALRAVTDSIVTWIRSGFQGNPLFITDFQGYLADAADQATGQFMKEFLSPEVYNAICSPFRLQLRLALSRRYTYADRMRCTLSTVLNNDTNFGSTLKQGDWYDFANVTLNDANNPFGSFILTSDQLSLMQMKAQENARTESIFNQGFLSMKKCVETRCEMWGEDASGDRYCVSEKCIRHENTSPGKWVSDTLSQATGIDMQRLAVADEINEILVALISQLLTGILQR